MYYNNQWVKLLCHHQAIHYKERERTSGVRFSSEWDGGSEEWLSRGGTTADDERWLRMMMNKKQLLENLAPKRDGPSRKLGPGTHRQSELLYVATYGDNNKCYRPVRGGMWQWTRGDSVTYCTWGSYCQRSQWTNVICFWNQNILQVVLLSATTSKSRHWRDWNQSPSV